MSKTIIRLWLRILCMSGVMMLTIANVFAVSEKIPTSGIDYSRSQIRIFFTKNEATADLFSCFHGIYNQDNQFGINEPGRWNGNTIANAIRFTLDELGLFDTNDVLDIIYKRIPAENQGCFQNAGTYDFSLLLFDEAGNAGLYPDPGQWFTFEVLPANPVVIDFDLSDTSGMGGNFRVEADGRETYIVYGTFRDKFGNKVIQLTSKDHIKLTVLDGMERIEIDGLFAPATTEVPENDDGVLVLADGTPLEENIFNNDSSGSVFVENVNFGTGASTQKLRDLLNGGTITHVQGHDENPAIPAGTFRFEISSRAPSMKLIDPNDPLQGAGVFAQRLNFDANTHEIDNQGNLLTGGPRSHALEQPSFGRFAFFPILEARPQDIGNEITWGSTIQILTDTLLNVADNINRERYLLLTRFKDYLLQREYDHDGDGGTPNQFALFSLPLDISGNPSATQSEDDMGFFPTSGDITSAPPSGIGIGAQVEYEIAGRTIRHTSGLASTHAFPPRDPALDCGDTHFEECYPFNPTASARIIGADIEGLFRGSREEVLIYEVDTFGQQTSYAGNITNDTLRDSLLRNIENAIRNPEQEHTNDVNLDDITFPGGDVVVVKGANLILGNGDGTKGDDIKAPSGKKTIIVVDGNVLLEDNLRYNNSLDSLGVITYNTVQNRADGQWPDTGHLFVDEKVKHFVGSHYLDGSLISLTSDDFDDVGNGSKPASTLIYQGEKENQLVLEGVVWSNNTLGGSLISSGNYISPWHNEGVADNGIARLFDLHFVRRYNGSDDGSGSTCHKPSAGTCHANTNAFVISIDNKAVYPETAPPVFRDMPAIQR